MVGYAEVAKHDEITERLKGLTHQWRSTVGLGDRELAQLIRKDGIDILVDLAGHTAHNRLGTFTYRPAPVQVTYLGYFTTTGLSAMDYWLTDHALHPETTPEQTTEKIHRLPRCWISYLPNPDCPEPHLRRRDNPRGVVFGSFNNLRKITPPVVALWSRLLKGVPEATLLLKTRQLKDPHQQQNLLARFAQHGIGPERLTLTSPVSGYAEHMALYGEMDIALAPFPCTGGTTSTDTLWMGVPVVTLAGDHFIERMSLSMLTAIGRVDLIAENEDRYVEIAQQLAQKGPRSDTDRLALHHQVAASPLYDAVDLTRHMEKAYRTLWQEKNQS
ncbi:MAG: hypothetical protein HQL52_05600 [Magnetococcales bacterium]|nr:hypothetical protein [Magnetococcales bacterium]